MDINKLHLSLYEANPAQTLTEKDIPENFQFTTSTPQQLTRLRQLDKFMVGHKGYVAGGCFKDIFTGQLPRDVDVFFENQQDFNDAKKYFGGNQEFTPIPTTNNKVEKFRHTQSNVIVELVKSTFGLPIPMISNFDFTIVKVAYCKTTDGAYEMLHHPKFFEHLCNNKLVIDDEIPFPYSTFNRLLRYVRKGFVACGETKINLITALSELDLSTDVPQGLVDFYGGID